MGDCEGMNMCIRKRILAGLASAVFTVAVYIVAIALLPLALAYAFTSKHHTYDWSGTCDE